MHRPLTVLARTAAACLLIALAISGSAVGKEPKRFELTIAERQLAEGGPTIKVEEGDEVKLVWRSDESANLHLHGYDIEFVVIPGNATVVDFSASTAGRFPITVHSFAGEHDHSDRPLVYIEVHPE
jgi:FtsP/CotA-like multicopper oxidase with cupredoxin domain